MTYRVRQLIELLGRHDRSAPGSSLLARCSWRERAGEIKRVDFSRDGWLRWALASGFSLSLGVVGLLFAPGSTSRVGSVVLLLAACIFIAAGVKVLDWRINRRTTNACLHGS